MTLDILACGAVTAVGLDAFQTAAAFRAGVGGFRASIPLRPPQDPLLAARIPTKTALRRSPRMWLANLAARAIRESLGYRRVGNRVGLVLTIPDASRQHAALKGMVLSHLLGDVSDIVGYRFKEAEVAGDGSAGIASSLLLAAEWLQRGRVDACVVGGVDSLVNDEDVRRFRETGRLLEPDNPRGLIPGEGAAMIVVTVPGAHAAVASLFGVGQSTEEHGVVGPRFSQGRGYAAALQAACDNGAVAESAIAFRVSTANGEHYSSWESLLFATRFYRTRRAHLPVWYTAASVGELGAAAGATAIVLTAFGIAGGYAPGPVAMVEAASESGQRAGCLVGPAAAAMRPPFRPEHGASVQVRKAMRS